MMLKIRPLIYLMDVLINSIMEGKDSAEDAQSFNMRLSEKFPCISYAVGILCCSIHRTFCLTFLALLHDLDTMERFSLVVGFWYLLVSVMVLVLWQAKALPVLLVITIISVVFKCKLESCMENAQKSTNPVLRLLIMVVCWMEQLTFLLFLIVALLFSVVECVCLSCCCVGGEPQVIPGRESVEDISWDTLIADINNSRDGYCLSVY